MDFKRMAGLVALAISYSAHASPLSPELLIGPYSASVSDDTQASVKVELPSADIAYKLQTITASSADTGFCINVLEVVRAKERLLLAHCMPAGLYEFKIASATLRGGPGRQYLITLTEATPGKPGFISVQGVISQRRNSSHDAPLANDQLLIVPALKRRAP